MGYVRSLLLAGAAGLGAASAASLLIAGRSEADTLSAIAIRIEALPGRPRDMAAAPAFQSVSAPPLFPVLAGPDALPDAVVRLEGVARSPARTAALVSVNNAAAGWMTVGDSRDGVTLEEIGASSITIDTPRGPRMVHLGEGAAPGGGAVSPMTSAPPAGSAALSEIPPGVRSPPEPASAPEAQP